MCECLQKNYMCYFNFKTKSIAFLLRKIIQKKKLISIYSLNFVKNREKLVMNNNDAKYI